MFYVKKVINVYFTTLSDIRYSLLLKIRNERKKYKAFEGITVVYWDVHKKEALVTYPASDQFIEISHCREGRVELESGGEFVYLGGWRYGHYREEAIM